jgi:hypothetical protein
MDIPALAIFRDYGHALFVVAGQYANNFFPARRMKLDLLANAEVHHLSVRPHLPQKSQAGDDLVVEVDELFF